jgi:signal transduction histidine kinase
MPLRLRPLRPRSQRARLVVLFAGLLASLFAVLAVWLPAHLHETMRGFFEARALDVAAHAASACEPALDFEDPVGAEAVLTRLGAARGATYAVLEREGGEIVSSWRRPDLDQLAPPLTTERTLYQGGLLHVRVPLATRAGHHGALAAGFALDDLTEARRHAALDVGSACLAVFAVGVGVCFLLGTVLVRPLRRMVVVASRITAGDHDAARELSVEGGDEAAALSRALAVMLNRLYEHRATIESLNAGLEQRVAERTAALAAANAELGERLAELKRTQEQLIVADRRVSIGRLAAGVAHEINNPLAFIEANLRFAAEELPALAEKAGSGAPAAVATVAEVAEAIAESRQGAERVRHIVRGLKSFARTDEDRRETLDLAGPLRAALDMSAHEVKHRARLEVELAAAPRVQGNEVRLSQVFLNLVMNAAQAIPEGKEGGLVRVTLGTDARGWALATVQDNGSGIAPEHLSRIFDPFFTTKPVGVGTGLGLSISQGIVLAFGGELSVESAPGAGATFRVAFPAATGGEQPLPPPPPLPPSARRKLLVVDDEPLVCQAVRRALARHHDVAAATSAPAALKQLAGGDRFDLILCDLMMPEMTGMEFHDALARLSPEQAARVVFMTGGAFTDGARAFLERYPGPALDKPLDLEQLRRIVDAHA